MSLGLGWRVARRIAVGTVVALALATPGISQPASTTPVPSGVDTIINIAQVATIDDEANANKLIAARKRFDSSARPEPRARGNQFARTYAASIKRSGPGTLDFDNAQAWTLQSGQKLVSVPIIGSSLTSESHLSLFIGKSGIEHQLEQIFTPIDEHSGRGQFWQDGRLIFDKIANDQGMVADPGQIAQIGWSFSKFNSCLSSQGVAGWAVVLIGVTCSIACAATLGWGCLVCLSSITFISGTVLGYCAAKART